MGVERNSIETMDYSPCFSTKSDFFTLAKNDIIGKGISRGADWHKFELHSSFQ